MSLNCRARRRRRLFCSSKPAMKFLASSPMSGWYLIAQQQESLSVTGMGLKIALRTRLLAYLMGPIQLGKAQQGDFPDAVL